MVSESDEILRREFKHGKTAYGFQWNVSHHKRIGHESGDLASLYAHLSTIQRGQVPEEPFSDPVFTRASRLRLDLSSRSEKTALRLRLEKAGSIETKVDDDLVNNLRQYHRDIGDQTYSADHSILSEFVRKDPFTIAIEVPVWSDGYGITGHIDVIRVVDGVVQVADYKPGGLETVRRRFLDSLPQVAAYGELLALHLAGTLHSALESPLLPEVKCAIFDTHACWHFDAKLFVQLRSMGVISKL
jgi:hypothetical protein